MASNWYFLFEDDNKMVYRYSHNYQKRNQWLKTHNPIKSIKDHCENGLNLRHMLDRICMTSYDDVLCCCSRWAFEKERYGKLTYNGMYLTWFGADITLRTFSQGQHFNDLPEIWRDDVGLSLGYETWLPFGWYHPLWLAALIIGWDCLGCNGLWA